MSNLFNKGFEVYKKQGFLMLTKKIFYYFAIKCINPIVTRVIINKIKNESYNLSSINELVNFAFNFHSFGVIITPAQIKYEIIHLLKLLKKQKPKIVLEIGTASGGTLFLFSRISDPEAIIISLDLPEGPYGGGYPKWKIPIYHNFKLVNQQLFLLRVDSHKLQTLESVNEILNGQFIDFLYVDGDHSYKGVKKDFEMYSKLVRKNGIIAFHDIVMHPDEEKCEVKRFWDEMKNNYSNTEIIQNYSQEWGGIGIIYK